MGISTEINSRREQALIFSQDQNPFSSAHQPAISRTSQEELLPPKIFGEALLLPIQQ